MLLPPELAADRLDSVGLAVLVDEGGHLRNGRSSSAWAKYADAFFRISLAVRNSLTSRSSSLIRALSSLRRPGRTPMSRSAWMHHPRSVEGEHPSFAAMDWQQRCRWRNSLDFH